MKSTVRPGDGTRVQFDLGPVVCGHRREPGPADLGVVRIVMEPKWYVLTDDGKVREWLRDWEPISEAPAPGREYWDVPELLRELCRLQVELRRLRARARAWSRSARYWRRRAKDERAAAVELCRRCQKGAGDE